MAAMSRPCIASGRGLPDGRIHALWPLAALSRRLEGGQQCRRLETDGLELGVEWQPWEALELTLAYAHMKRREADERRLGRAEGDLIRTPLQWNC